MKSTSASARLQAFNLKSKVTTHNNHHTSPGSLLDGPSLISSLSEPQACNNNFFPISTRDYVGHPLEDFDSPHTNVSQIIF